MKDATPEKDKAILAIIRLIKKVDHKCLFPEKKYIYKSRSDKEVLAEYQKIKAKVLHLYEDVLFDELSLEKIKSEILLRSDKIVDFDRSSLLTTLEALKKVLIKKLSKKEKAKDLIQGLILPVKWEDITFIFDGNNVDVKQNSSNLGMYSLADLGIPKRTNKKSNSVPDFFVSLFLMDKVTSIKALSSTENSNQKNKGKLSQILKNVFKTNIDPFEINKKLNQYIPLFNARLGGDLRINEYSSGGKFYDETDPTLSDYN